MFYIGEGFDDGDIIGQEEFTIDETDCAGVVYDKVIESGRKLVFKYVPLLSQGISPRIAQDNSMATIFEKRNLQGNRIDLEKDTKDKEKILKKLDDLFDQNKVIARGLTLLHEPVQKMEPPSPQQSEPSQMQPPVPSPKIQQLPPVQMIPRDQYQLSISSNPQRFKQLPRG